MNTLVEREAMKFVLNGRVYDTETSVVAAISRGVLDTSSYDAADLPDGASSKRYEKILYRTAKGNFFVHNHETIKYQRGKPVVDDFAQAFTPEDAILWIQSNVAMVVDPTGLPLPDEA
jgi:hypothetical protein